MDRLPRNTIGISLLAIFTTAAIVVLFYWCEQPTPSVLQLNAAVVDAVSRLVAVCQWHDVHAAIDVEQYTKMLSSMRAERSNSAVCRVKKLIRR